MSSALVNIFEDDHTIRDGNWLKAIRECEVIPEDYGVCWYRPTEAVAICAPMPFHTLLGWAYRAYWHWRARWGLESVTIAQQAFARGAQAERERHDRHLAAVLELNRREQIEAVDAAQARGYAAGQRDMLRDVRQIFHDERSEGN